MLHYDIMVPASSTKETDFAYILMESMIPRKMIEKFSDDHYDKYTAPDIGRSRSTRTNNNGHTINVNYCNRPNHNVTREPLVTHEYGCNPITTCNNGLLTNVSQ